MLQRQQKLPAILWQMQKNASTQLMLADIKMEKLSVVVRVILLDVPKMILLAS
jgi:hypothetical protein